MSIHPRRFLLSLACALVLVVVLFTPLVSSPVSAGGSQPVLPGGSSLKPGEATPIQLSAENVTMNIRPATEADNTLIDFGLQVYSLQRLPVWFPAIAEVETDFTLKNPTAEEITLTVWFPLASALENVDWKPYPEALPPRMESLQVSVAGKKVAYASSDLPNPGGADKPPLPWANFPVTFPAGKETVIRIHTIFPLQPSVSGIEMTLYHVFHTGAGWAGAVGGTTLIINLPYPATTDTLAGIPPGTLRMPPYYRPANQVELPRGAVLEGNQARWTWMEREPGIQDDFAIWLLKPDKWQELESVRSVVKAKPGDGQKWLDLGSTYYSLSSNGPEWPTVFGSVFLPQGIEAFKQAVHLLPERPAAHAGLGLTTLLLTMDKKDALLATIRSIQDELQIARDLEAKNPSMAKETGQTRWLLSALETNLVSFFTNEETATAEYLAWSTEWIKKNPGATLQPTLAATLPRTHGGASTLAPTGTPTWEPTFTSTSIPSSTSQPFTTPSPTAASPEPVERGSWMMTGSGLVAVGMLVLIIAGYLVYNRSRNRADK